MIIYFVRHGESVATAMGEQSPAGHDMSLTETGKREAESVRSYFEAERILLDRVYSSSLVRAVETAEPTATHFSLTISKDDRLRERDWGSMNSYTWIEVAERLKPMPIEERYQFIPEGGESWAQMEERVLASLTDILKSDAGSVAVFTHGGVLRGLLPVLAKVDKSEHARFTMKTGGIAGYDSVAHTVTLLN